MAKQIIRNPEHYFNRFIACEIKNDRKRAGAIREFECSLDEKVDEGNHPRELIYNLNGELLDQVGGFLDKIGNDRLHEALCTLSAEQMELIKMVFADGLTQREIAQMLGVSQKTVCKRVQGAMVALKKFLHNPILGYQK